MFAIIEDGSHQFQVSKGQRLRIDYRAAAQEGDTIAFDKVLLASGGGASVIGRPLIDGATVNATVLLPEEKGEKIEIQKIRRRKKSRRHTGHRQKYTIVSVGEINVPGLEVFADTEAEAEPTAVADEATTTEEPAADETTSEE